MKAQPLAPPKEDCKACQAGDCPWHDELLDAYRDILLEAWRGDFSLEELLVNEATLEGLK